MLTNYITTPDIERLYPDIISFRRGGQVDFQNTINAAFDAMVADFQARGKNVRNLMVPVDLNRDASSPMLQYLKATTKSASQNGYAWQGHAGREGRFVVYVSANTGGAWKLTLQGSNEPDRPAENSTYWSDVVALTIPDDTHATGQFMATFGPKFRWYRRVVTLVSGSGDLSFTAAIEETTFDSLVVNKAIELICAGINTGMSPMWAGRLELARANYDDTIKALQYSVDDNEDGSPDGDDIVTGGVDIWR